MHARELVDLAAFVAAEGPVLLGGARPLSADILGQYWTASKCRLERWTIALRQFRDQPVAAWSTSDQAWQAIRPVCEEVFVTEILSRVWSNVLTALDSKTATCDAQPVAASVLAGHIDAATRVLELQTDGLIPVRGADDLNRLRRLTEHCTDLLLGFLDAPGDVSRFAHDAARAKGFTSELAHPGSSEGRRHAWGVLSASLRNTFARRLQGETPNGDLNSRIAGSILACFPAELFDSSGAYHSLWMLRLSAAATDSQVLVEELLASDGNGGGAPQFKRNRLLPRQGKNNGRP